MMNKVLLLGYLGADPELIVLESQQALCKMRLATSSPVKDENGMRRTEWHNIVVFGRTALNCAEFLRSGSLAFVEGRIQSREYTDKSGEQRRVTEIVASTVQFLGNSKPEQQPARLDVFAVDECNHSVAE